MNGQNNTDQVSLMNSTSTYPNASRPVTFDESLASQSFERDMRKAQEMADALSKHNKRVKEERAALQASNEFWGQVGRFGTFIALAVVFYGLIKLIFFGAA
jgi:hypothetical protein